MSTANEQLGEQVIELTQIVQEMGGLVRDAAQEKLGQLRTNVSEHYEQGRDKVHSVEQTFEEYVVQRPLQSVLIAAGVGLLVGRFWLRP